MVCYKCRCRRDSFYDLSYSRLVLPGDELARLVHVEPACGWSGESKRVLGIHALPSAVSCVMLSFVLRLAVPSPPPPVAVTVRTVLLFSERGVFDDNRWI